MYAPSLKMINAFLEAQEDRCKICHHLFEHCGGEEKNSLALLCEELTMEMQGVICQSCAFDLRNEQKIAQ
jgi:hypothetical protein